MGGDFAPEEPVKGAVLAVAEDPALKVKLFGKEETVKAELAKYSYGATQIEVIPCTQVIETSEAPVDAVRKKKDSSMIKALYAVKKKEADAFVSCGNTGALLVGGQVIVGRLKGVERPALAFIMPTLKGPALLIDCGASTDAKAKWLVQFAQMGSIYMKNIVGIANPRVGIINIGEEDEKGNSLVKETIPLLRQCESINFTGSVESRGITEGQADVVVCDAFTGNVVLKMYEGVAAALLKEIKGALVADAKSKAGALLIKKSLKKTLRKFSIEEYGGAPFLGIKAPVLKTHGSSKAAEIKNTVLQCRMFVEKDVPGKIEAQFRDK